MSSIKFHVARPKDAATVFNDGTASCDFRGPLSLGDAEGDEHATAFEIKNASDGLIVAFLAEGPAINQGFAAARLAEPGAFAEVATALGLKGEGDPYIRVGVWDPGVEG